MAQTQPTVILTNSPNVFDIPLSKIVANPKENYRTQKDPKAQEELTESMKRQGQLQAVEVVAAPNGMFSLVLGFRRFEAAKTLELPTIRAEVVTGKDGQPLDEKNRRIRNAAENLARENLTPYDQALAFVDLKKNFDMSANLIGENTGKSVSYINNLVRIYESLDDSVLNRWKQESNPTFGFDKEGKAIPNSRQVCTMNWLVSVIKEPKAEQEVALKRALGLIPDEDDTDDTDDADPDREPRQPGTTSRASMVNLKKAKAAAEKGKKEAKADEKLKFDGILLALKFAIGEKQSIPGVYTAPKPGEKDDE